MEDAPLSKNNYRFDISNRNALITGGGGFLGPEHAIALSQHGAIITLIDIDQNGLTRAKNQILSEVEYAEIKTVLLDITDEDSLLHFRNGLGDNSIDILVNNAAINPKMNNIESGTSGMVENYDMNMWNQELNVGITGTFLCSKIFGSVMANNGYGNIINVASDLAILGPDHRVYSSTGEIEDVQHFKPIGYSVVKSAMLGITRYLATYWAHKGVRVNCLVPGAVFNYQSESLVKQVSDRIPLRRMANHDEYREAIVFLASEASSYMTGQMLVIDGGRSTW